MRRLRVAERPADSQVVRLTQARLQFDYARDPVSFVTCRIGRCTLKLDVVTVYTRSGLVVARYRLLQRPAEKRFDPEKEAYRLLRVL